MVCVASVGRHNQVEAFGGKAKRNNTKNYFIMKKTLLFMVLGLGLTSVANAQYEPKKEDIATEIGFTPFIWSATFN